MKEDILLGKGFHRICLFRENGNLNKNLSGYIEV